MYVLLLGMEYKYSILYLKFYLKIIPNFLEIQNQMCKSPFHSILFLLISNVIKISICVIFKNTNGTRILNKKKTLL